MMKTQDELYAELEQNKVPTEIAATSDGTIIDVGTGQGEPSAGVGGEPAATDIDAAPSKASK